MQARRGSPPPTISKSRAETSCASFCWEESGEIGGISRTVRHNGCRIDLGGHRFFSKNEQVNALWQEIMPMQGAPSMDDRVLSRDVPLSVGRAPTRSRKTG